MIDNKTHSPKSNALSTLKIEERDIVINNKLVHYSVVGSGPPVLFIHGLNFGWKQWERNITVFAQKYKIYSIDLPGCGDSADVDFRFIDPINDHVKIVEQFVDKLQLKEPHVIGHSIGAWIALQMAKREKVSIGKIIAIGPFGFPAHFRFEQILLLMLPIVTLLTKTAVSPTLINMRNFLRAPLSDTYKYTLTDQMAENYYLSVVKSAFRHPLFLIYSYSKSLKQDYSLRLVPPNLKNIPNKVLLIIGEKDPYISVKEIKNFLQLLPMFSLHIFPDSGHIPSLEEAELFNKIVIRYME